MSALAFVERPAAVEPQGLLVLHHGRGTDERDLIGLADALDPAGRLHVVSPRAPLSLPGSPGFHWYLVPRVGYPDPETFDGRARGARGVRTTSCGRARGCRPQRRCWAGSRWAQ